MIHRNDALEKFQTLVQKRTGHRIVVDVLLYRFVTSREMFQRLHVIRIDEETYVQHKIGVKRHAVLEAKRTDRHLQSGRIARQDREDLGAQLGARQRGSIDDTVGNAPELRQLLAFEADPFQQGVHEAKRMTPTRQAIAAQQHILRRFEKKNLDVDALLFQIIEHARQTVRKIETAHVDHGRYAVFQRFGMLRQDPDQLRKHADGNVVDRKKALIFQKMQRAAFPAAGQPRDDQQFFRKHGLAAH